jgi:cysteine desulfurase
MEKTYQKIGYGNPSITHKIGWESYEILHKSSQTLSESVGVSPSELTYTHNATEANNLALLGSAKANKTGKHTILVSSIEHLSVIFPAERLQEQGYTIKKIPVDTEGFIDHEALKNLVDNDTFLVSIAPINHELGTIQDIHELTEIVKDKNPNILFHIDAADTLGRIPLNLKKLNIDLASFSSHKVYGPKGAGALYIKDTVKIEPLLHGQLSSQKLWPGAENIPAIAGFAKAVKLMETLDKKVLLRLRDTLITGITTHVSDVKLNGPQGAQRTPDNVNTSFLYVEGEAIIVELSMRGIYASSGSACTSRVLQPSHILLAIGRKYEEAHGSVLMKITPFIGEDDIKYVIEEIPKGITRLRSISPIKRREDKGCQVGYHFRTVQKY